VREINNYIVEDFANKVYAAKKTNQKSITLDIKEAQNLVENLTIILARALGNVERNNPKDDDSVVSVSMDGGGF
jgi:hypothetical protein